MDKNLKINDLIEHMDKNDFKKIEPFLGIFISPDITLKEIYNYIEKNNYSWDIFIKHYLNIIAGLYKSNPKEFFVDIINWLHHSNDPQFITHALHAIGFVPEDNDVITLKLKIINQVLSDNPHIGVIYEVAKLLHKASKIYPQILTNNIIYIRITYKLYKEFINQIELLQQFESNLMVLKRLDKKNLQEDDFLDFIRFLRKKNLIEIY